MTLLDEQLFDAASGGRQDEVASLLRRRANVNAADDDGYTALHYASSCGHDKLVEIID